MLEEFARILLTRLYDRRSEEYAAASAFLNGCETVLDVGCGTGTFLERHPEKYVGIDINPENIAFCQDKGLNAEVGDALNIAFPDHSFDAVHCSHVMQVFDPDQAVQLIRELSRVTRPGGIVVISTLNWFNRFYRHPENVRPYPPDSIARLFARRRGASSPMYPDVPFLEQTGIWFRRSPLIEFYSVSNQTLNRYCLLLNAIQYGFRLRKYWTFDSYVIAFRKMQRSP